MSKHRTHDDPQHGTSSPSTDDGVNADPSPRTPYDETQHDELPHDPAAAHHEPDVRAMESRQTRNTKSQDATLINVDALKRRIDKLEASVRSLVDIVHGMKGSGYHPYDVIRLED